MEDKDDIKSFNSKYIETTINAKKCQRCKKFVYGVGYVRCKNCGILNHIDKSDCIIHKKVLKFRYKDNNKKSAGLNCLFCKKELPSECITIIGIPVVRCDFCGKYMFFGHNIIEKTFIRRGKVYYNYKTYNPENDNKEGFIKDRKNERVNEILSNSNIEDNAVTVNIDDIVVKLRFKEMKNLNVKIEPVNAYIVIGNKAKRFNLYFNKDENIYFGYMRDLDFEGIPYCKVYTYKDYICHKKDNNYDLKPVSVMKSYGYQITGKTDSERHNALKFIIDNEIMSWVEMVEFIEWLISMRGENHCVDIYYDDIEWIRTYIYPNMKSVKVKTNNI